MSPALLWRFSARPFWHEQLMTSSAYCYCLTRKDKRLFLPTDACQSLWPPVPTGFYFLVLTAMLKCCTPDFTLLQQDSFLPQWQRYEANISPHHLHVLMPSRGRLKFCPFTFCQPSAKLRHLLQLQQLLTGVLDSHLNLTKHFLCAWKMTVHSVSATMLSSSSGKGCCLPHHPDCAWFEAAYKIYFCVWKQSLPAESQSQSGLFK